MLALPLLFFIPFLAAALVFSLSKITDRNCRNCACILSLIPLVFLLLGGSKWQGALYDHAWLPTLGIRFHLAIDNLSLIFLYLTNIIVPIAILANTCGRANLFYGLILSLQGLLIGFFTSCDLVFFTFFFEAILLPLYFLISYWGSNERQKTAMTFIIYMVTGSCLMVVGVLSLYFTAGTFDIAQASQITGSAPIIAAIFLLAFAVKTPLFPFHGWLPDTYCQASVPATILLSAILSKAGIYGIIRISLGIFPHQMVAWSPIILTLAIIGVLYGAFCAWGQRDYKRLIAYSSFSHVNFIIAGLFVWNDMAHAGAILQSVNHAITITGLFLVAGWLEKRLGTTYMGNVSGLTVYMPKLSWLTLFFVLSAVALPGLNNFISELMLLYGVFQYNMWLSGILGLTIILSVIYMLKWIHRMFFNEPSPNLHSYSDIKPTQMLLAAPLVALILWLGIYPGPVLDVIMPAAKKLYTTMSQI